MSVKKENLRNDFRVYPLRVISMLMLFLAVAFCLKPVPAYADVWGTPGRSKRTRSFRTIFLKCRISITHLPLASRV